MNEESSILEEPKGTLKSYILGFVLSILLTLTAYSFVISNIFSVQLIIAAVLAIAVIQLHVQLTFFLHFYKETKPRWNLFIFLMTVSFILVVVLGTIWIMGNLDERHSNQNGTNYLMEDERSY
jgi:cytochrome o ubiquinol oxidase operon protein cyoD